MGAVGVTVTCVVVVTVEVTVTVEVGAETLVPPLQPDTTINAANAPIPRARMIPPVPDSWPLERFIHGTAGFVTDGAGHRLCGWGLSGCSSDCSSGAFDPVRARCASRAARRDEPGRTSPDGR